jgi:hypothetical protein
MVRRAMVFFLAAIWMAILCLLPAHAAGPGELYDADPNHLWNRLHRALFVRTDAERTEYGWDQLDPLLWARSTHLLEGPSHEKAIQVLDEFLSRHGETMVSDPLKRALLQRDLWAVFDWTANRFSKASTDLKLRLATVIRRLALTKEQIQNLPDNYSEAVASRKFAMDYNQTNPAVPFLPGGLFSTNGPWVSVGLGFEQTIAPAHVSRFGGRSAFLVFMRTPNGREEARTYLKKFRDFPQPYLFQTNQFTTSGSEEIFTNIDVVLKPNLPQFPSGTTVALVRQMILVDLNGDLVPTHLTESVQIRRYNDVNPKPRPSGMPAPESQTFVEFLLSRRDLFAGVAGGLRAVAPDEREFRQFMDMGFDPFDEAERQHKPLSFHRAMDCMDCHGGFGVYSVHSFTQDTQSRLAALPQLTSLDSQPERERYAALVWKEKHFSWGLLQGIWAH